MFLYLQKYDIFLEFDKVGRKDWGIGWRRFIQEVSRYKKRTEHPTHALWRDALSFDSWNACAISTGKYRHCVRACHAFGLAHGLELHVDKGLHVATLDLNDEDNHE